MDRLNCPSSDHFAQLERGSSLLSACSDYSRPYSTEPGEDLTVSAYLADSSPDGRPDPPNARQNLIPGSASGGALPLFVRPVTAQGSSRANGRRSHQ